MSWLGTSSDHPAKRSGIVSVLDIGSHKICCIIAKLKPCEESQLLRGRTHRIQVLGIGHQRSRGVKSGVIVDLDRAEQAIRLAVDAAERMAGLTIDSLIVNLSSGRLKSEASAATVNLGGHETDDADVKRVLEAGARQALRHERQVVHTLPVGFSLDTERGIQDPRGMVGDVLGVDMHVLTADAAPLRNLELAINRAHLSVECLVATPYASGLSALVDDEGEMGAACIDIGAGTTTMSVFFAGKMVYASSIPIGGAHVTMDLARGLSTAMDDAERMKVMHGSALPANGDDRDLVTVQPIGSGDDDGGMQIPRAAMNRIIRARIEETLEIVRDRLTQSGSSHLVGKRVVLTGGGAQLQGLPESARRVLGRNVRIGRPLGVAGLPEAAKGPAFATAVGLMIYPQVADFEIGQVRGGVSHRLTGTGGRFSRVSQWLRNSF
ncbi:cell division protein FtsA [Tianweitania sediminis]|jgi:cell division protein FtsA|uniref:Cell division protein FtsA n=1 Tax=Tianweitania sediminis TaxID=1502156 RepID=A0A8J7R2R8_9HYPH|nr:cell division protein FtsA [Tianweitania sediminis]MBP0439195.1 cell division protein FtsA [Tianweitania sediminis]HEV7415498.1 cell division protein FtsA [Tianweitania sediminis]